MKRGNSKYLIGAIVGGAIVSLVSAPLLGKKQGEYQAKSASLEKQKRLSTSKDEIIAIQSQQAKLDKEQINLYKTYLQELWTVKTQLWHHGGMSTKRWPEWIYGPDNSEPWLQSYLDKYGYSVVTPKGNTQIQTTPRWHQEYRDAIEQ
jgi:gas vesicle protein